MSTRRRPSKPNIHQRLSAERAVVRPFALRSSAPLVLLLSLPGCSGPSAQTPPSAATASSTPAGGDPVSTQAAAPSGWVVDAPLGIREAAKGALVSVTLGDGTVVAALSYSSDSEPFLVFRGKPAELAKSVPPWKCVASPADLQASGADLWVDCMDPDAPEDKPRVHFWHSGDAGKTWSRAGAFDGAVAMDGYALAGPKLFVSGSFDGKPAFLQVIARDAGGKWAPTSAAGAPGWPKETLVRVGAAGDGASVAVLGDLDSKTGHQLALAASTDGGRTIKEVWRIPFRYKLVRAPSIADGALSALAENEEGLPAAVLTGPLGGGEPKVTPFPRAAEDACVHGAHVLVHWGKRDWQISSDHGATFEAVAAPKMPAGDELPPVLMCTKEGARFGAQLLAWPKARP